MSKPLLIRNAVASRSRVGARRAAGTGVLFRRCRRRAGIVPVGLIRLAQDLLLFPCTTEPIPSDSSTGIPQRPLAGAIPISGSPYPTRKGGKSMAGNTGKPGNKIEEAATHAGHRAQETATSVGHRAQETATSLGHRAQETASNLASQASNFASQAQDRAEGALS